jgi:hypothetical protein
MMVATMTLEIAATEFVDAAATRFAYRRLGPRSGCDESAPRNRTRRPSGHRATRTEPCQRSCPSIEATTSEFGCD